MKIIINFLIAFFIVYLCSCSPMKSSSKEEKHQLELTLHELQTNLDDLRHDINCFHTEIQIIDGKVKHQQDATQNLKQQHLEKIQLKIENLAKQINEMEKKISLFETKSNNLDCNLSNLSNHANETTLALTQHKDKIHELEKIILKQNSRLEDITKVKATLEDIVKTIKSNSSNYIIYKVKAKDSLEKIAKANNVTIEAIKLLNGLENDLIVVGQKLKIPK